MRAHAHIGCWLGLAVLSAMLLAGCRPGPSTPDGSAEPIRIGEFASLTGKEAAFGQSSHKGTLLAIEEINAGGGVLGRPLRLITEDNQSKPGESATVVRKLISRERVVAVLGEVASGRSLEAAPICQQNRIPMISPSSTNPKVTEMGDCIFRVCFLDSFQGAALARFARQTLKTTRVAILSDVAAPYSVGLAAFFRERFLAGAGQVVAEQKYSSGDKDFKAQLTAIRTAQPEAIFVPGYYTEVGLIALQARQLGISVPLFGGDGWEAPELIQIAGPALEGNYYSTHFAPEVESPVAQNFVQKFTTKYGAAPDAIAALGYDSALLLADAIRRAGATEKARLRDAIASTRDFSGASGLTTIDPQRNARKSAVMIAIRDGRFRYVQTITPDEALRNEPSLGP